MRNWPGKTFGKMSDSLLRIVFSESSLHRLFRAGNSKPGFLATFDLINFTKTQVVDLVEPHEKIGIVIQGPVVKGKTIDFCNFTRATYPEALIVVSTWDDEDISSFKGLRGPNFHIIQSRKPEFAGPSNINLQIVSSRAGIEYLEKLGCTHLLKTRTDIFLANAQFLNYLIWAKGKGESNAIVFSSFNSFLFRLFSVSDQVMFGNTRDIADFWKLNLVRPETSISIPEVHLFREYLKSQKFKPEENLNSYLSALEEFAVIADHEQLGQIWNKGSFTALSYRWRGSRFPYLMSPLSFWLWELARNNKSYILDLQEKTT